MATSSAPKPRPLTAHEFFALGLPGYSRTEAMAATGLCPNSITTASREKLQKQPSVRTLVALEKWSYGAIRLHGVYISTGKILDLPKPPFPSWWPSPRIRPAPRHREALARKASKSEESPIP